jgi:hypothetical protein
MSDLNKNKIVSLENFEELSDNFILRSPNRGKIYRGANWNAYNRESLGTIPRKSENILFKEHTNEKKGFLSQSERFSVRRGNESIKFSYPGPGTYSLGNISNNDVSIYKTTCTSINPSFSSKGYGNGFISKAERFDDPREYYERFYPGPGEYKNTRTSVSDIQLKTNLRYKSLYNTNKVKSLKVSKDNPGPGDYNPIIPLLLKKENTDLEKQNSFFASKEKRFENVSKDISHLPGPGRYFNNLESTSVRNPEKVSKFFISEASKKVDPMEKFLNISKVQKFKIPGPGEYNLRKEIIDFSKIKTHMPPLINEEEKDIEKEKEREIERINIMQRVKREIYNPYQSPFENSKKGISSVFQSRSPKEKYLAINHIPGPAYYNPSIIFTDKKSYNHNEERVWI